MPGIDNQIITAVDQAWSKALSTVNNSRSQGSVSKTRSGWKTIRLFVSSTFHDFQYERDILVKKIFPHLKAWCLQHHLNFIEIDLRWGIVRGMDADAMIQSCMNEIDRCYEENVFPFFLCMLSQRIGWVPKPDEVSDRTRQHFQWIDGLSITEMEVVHGALRSRNHNAIFLLRDTAFINSLPDALKSVFVHSSSLNSYKAKKFRDVITQNFDETQIVNYYAKFSGDLDASGTPKLEGFEELLQDKVLNFFIQRFSEQYPKIEEGEDHDSIWASVKYEHEAFLKSEASLIGQLPVWDRPVENLMEFLHAKEYNSIYLLYAKSGSGKSSCLSVFLDAAIKHNPNISTFYHFTGALPNSTNIKNFLSRLGDFLKLNSKDIDNVSAIKDTICNLKYPVLIAVDAFDQMTEKNIAWIPGSVPSNVKIIITCGLESRVHQMIQQSYDGKCISKELITIDTHGKMRIITETLGKYNKTLDHQQMSLLLNKKSSNSYYWLSLACEELRVFGHFEMLTDKIKNLPDDLVEFQCQILERFEMEQKYEDLFITTLCLILTSKTGLLEVELLELLAEPPNLLPPDLRELKYPKTLPINKWSEIFRDIRPFLLPMGDVRGGRLKIYHKTFGQAIEKRYLTSNDSRMWFNKKLGDYFSKCSVLERKVEEYPYHLIDIQDWENLIIYLSNTDIIRLYYNTTYSKQLLELWSLVDPTFNKMADSYEDLTERLISTEFSEETFGNMLMLASMCNQIEKYETAKTVIEICKGDLFLVRNDSLVCTYHFTNAIAQYYYEFANSNISNNYALKYSLEAAYIATSSMYNDHAISTSNEITKLLMNFFYLQTDLALKQEAIYWRSKALETSGQSPVSAHDLDVFLSDAVHEDNNYQKEKHLDKCESIIKNNFSEDQLIQIKFNEVKGKYLLNQRRKREALKYFNDSLQIIETVFGKFHPKYHVMEALFNESKL